MDTLAKGICDLEFSDWGQENWRLTMFADDVIILARSGRELQSMLDKCTEWAEATGMVWSTSKCAIVTRNKAECTFLLARDSLVSLPKTDYLGVTIDHEGVAEDKTVHRLKRARKRVQMISTLGMFRGGISSQKCINIFTTFIRPLWEYSIHLTPHTVRIRKEHSLVMQDVVQAIFGKWARKYVRRLSILCGFEPEKQRRATLARSLLHRLEIK